MGAYVQLVRKQSGFQVIRDWMPFILCILSYANLHHLIHLVNPVDRDDVLLRIDAWLFGTQPSLWLEPYVRPWLTTIMAQAYANFFLYPPLLATVLYLRDKRQAFRESLVSVVVCFYLGYVGYILVPAVGPVVTLRNAYTVPLETGYYGKNLLKMIAKGSIGRDCFPSLHTGVRWSRGLRPGATNVGLPGCCWFPPCS